MRLGIIVTAVNSLVSLALALPAPRPNFDPRSVVRQVRQAGRREHRRGSRSRPSSRHATRPRRPVPAPAAGLEDGEFLVDTSITLMPGPYDRTLPAVAFDGSNFLVVWEDDRGFDWYYDIYGARVTPAGVVLDPTGIAICEATDDQYCPAVGFNGPNFMVVWEDYRDGDYLDIFGARVSPEGEVLDPAGIAVCTARDDQFSAALESDGENFLVAWEDYRGDWEDIYGARVTPDGTVLDPSGFVISHGDRDQCYPAVGFDSANFLVVWEDYRGVDGGDIYGARVTPDGVVLDTSGITVSTAVNGQYYPALSYAGGNFLVAWEDYRSGSSYDVYGTRVSPQGAVLDPSGLAISRASDDQAWVDVGSDSANFLVVWEDYRSADDIYGARVTPTGTVLDPSGINLTPVADYEFTPAVGFGGGSFLVVMENDTVGMNIFGARVTPQGATLDSAGFIISRAAQDQYSPVVGFDGADFVVAWEDFRSGTKWDIYGARVTTAGAVRDTWPVTTRDRDQVLLALACTPGGRMLAAYQSWTGTVGGRGYFAPRVWGRLGRYAGIEGEGRLQPVSGDGLIATMIRGVLDLEVDSLCQTEFDVGLR